MKSIILPLAISVNVFAQNTEYKQDYVRDNIAPFSSGVTSIIPVTSTMATLGTLGQANEIIMVKEDAVIAIETGFVSDNLKSVIEKLKSSDRDLSSLSDEQLIEIIITN